MAQTFDEIRNAKGVLYKLNGKLSTTKDINVSLTPKTCYVYFHINDLAKSKSVSLSLSEAMAFKTLMATMDVSIKELLSSNPPAQGKKRKVEDGIAETESLLAEFDIYQPYGSQHKAGYATSMGMNKESLGAQGYSYAQPAMNDPYDSNGWHQQYQHSGVTDGNQQYGNYKPQSMDQQYQTYPTAQKTHQASVGGGGTSVPPPYNAPTQYEATAPAAYDGQQQKGHFQAQQIPAISQYMAPAQYESSVNNIKYA